MGMASKEGVKGTELIPPDQQLGFRVTKESANIRTCINNDIR